MRNGISRLKYEKNKIKQKNTRTISLSCNLLIRNSLWAATFCCTRYSAKKKIFELTIL